MRRERVVVDTLCDCCGEVIPTNGLQLAAGPLDFCMACARMGVCEGCGSLPSFPKQSVVVWGNCMGCWRRAMALPRGKCIVYGGYFWGTSDRFAPDEWPACALVGICTCRNLPRHPGHHECLCGATW